MKSRSIAVSTLAAFLLACSGSTMLPAQTQRDNQLYKVRNSVWRAWFSNDVKALHALVPADAIVISGGEQNWKHQAEVLQSAADFQSAGNKLVRLEFPHTEIQYFGKVAIVWSDYLVETESHGKRAISSGRASEIFVKRNGRWINPGWHTDSTK